MKDFAAHCVICDSVAEFIKCSVRLIIEKYLTKNIALVKHHGLHACRVKVEGRPKKSEVYMFLYFFDLVFCVMKHSQN